MLWLLNEQKNSRAMALESVPRCEGKEQKEKKKAICGEYLLVIRIFASGKLV